MFGLVRGVLLSPWLLALVCLWTEGENVSVSHAAAAGGVVRVEQIYDADGQRVGKRVVTLDPDTGLSHTNEQRFLLEGLNPTGYAQVSGVIGRESGQGWRVTQRSLHGQGLVGTATRRSEAVPGQAGGLQIRHVMADGHGSVRQELEEEASGPPRIYTAWGEDVGVGGLRDDVGMGWGYAGEVWDGALGMYELRARQYRPTTGRFWTMDRFEGRSREPLSLHKYLYASANPVNMFDPSGHMSISDVYYSMGARVYLASARMAAYPQAVGIAKATVAAVTVGSLILSDEARVAYLATGNPAAVAASLADDVGVLLYRGGGAIQRVGSSIARIGVLNKLEQPLAASAQQIRSVADDAMIGFRGSLATGVKHRTGGPFDPTDFDLDAFIVSDKLARQTYGRFRDGNNIPGVAAEADKIQKQLQTFSGHRSDKPFTFRIWTTEEYERIVKEGPHVIQ